VTKDKREEVMKVITSTLAETLQKVMPGIGRDKLALEGADTVVFSKTGMHTYNDNISVTVPFPTKEMTGAVKGEKLYQLIQKIKAPDVELDVVDKHLSVKAGNIKAKLNLVESSIEEMATSLHDLKKEDNKKLPAQFHEALKHCSIRGNSSNFAGVVVEKDTMISTDQLRSNSYNMEEKMTPFWLSQQNVEELLKIDQKLSKFTHYTIAESNMSQWIHFITEDDTVFSCALKDLSVYPITALIDQKISVRQEESEIDGEFPEGFAEAVDRCSVFSSQSENTGLAFVRLTLSTEGIAISGKQAAGTAEETVNWSKPIKLENPIKVSFSSDFLLQAVGKVKNFSIKYLKGRIAGGTKSKMPVVMLHNQHFTHIIAGLVD